MAKQHVVFISLPMSGLSEEQIQYNLSKARSYYLCRSERPLTEVTFVDNLNCPQPPENPFPGYLPSPRMPIWYLSQALVKLSLADEVLFFPGWEKARGCIVERSVCTTYDIPMYDMEEKKNDQAL